MLHILNRDGNDLGVNIEAIMISLLLALAHFILEFYIIYKESESYRINYLPHIATSLTGRLNWIPYYEEMT